MTKAETQTASAQSSRRDADDASLARALSIAKAAIDKKAENLRVLDLAGVSSFTDYFVLCGGTSPRQVQAIAESITTTQRAAGVRPISVEGLTEGRWVLMDYGDVVVHIFLDALRDYYDIEKLWAEAPRVKIPSEFYGDAASRVN